MRLSLPHWLLAFALLCCDGAAQANDVDGPDDCTRPSRDFGDAPDGSLAYPGIMGFFPTCMALGTPAGNQTFVCPSLSSPPGAANGFVRNENPAGAPPYWLGCSSAGGPPLGIDSEGEAKTNSIGAPSSACSPNQPIDCLEVSWLTFGQDECYGDDDAGVAAAVSFTTCQSATISFRAYNCLQTARVVTLNILVDWNMDGDWNDNFECPGFPATTCSHEWAVKNATIVLPPGCSNVTAPSFLAGPNAGRGWMRITISDNAVPDDFPWNGSASLAGGVLIGGETEDYPVSITSDQTGCGPYRDYGDAPEEIQAYSNGVIGHFPTCEYAGAPGTRDIQCGVPSGPPPGPTGFVRHDNVAADVNKFWLGCPVGTFIGVDSEVNGKVNIDPPFGNRSACDPNLVTVDCFEPAWLNFGQDECYGDADAGVIAPLLFSTCTKDKVTFRAYNCSTVPRDVFLNVLVDWNMDGDWNDNVQCGAANPKCALEWAVKNVPIPLNPGCNAIDSPLFQVGGNVGEGWLRITLTEGQVPDDFPWNGSVSMPNQSFRAGETEDYPVRIAQSLGVRDDEPQRMTLAAAAPNPSKTWTQLSWSQPKAAHATLSIYDVIGRRVAKLVDGASTAGAHRVTWSFRNDDGSTVAPGIYLAKLRIGNEELRTQIVRLR